MKILPKSIPIRLSNNPMNAETFKEAAGLYNAALHFKTGYNLHNSSFRLPHKRSTTTLSEHLWKLKDASIGYTIEWTILDKKPCSPASKCDRFILLDRSTLLTKRSEIFGTCTHRKRTPPKFQFLL